MRKFRGVVGLVLMIAWVAGSANAGWPERWSCPKACPTCPDDYRPKPLPGAPCPSQARGPDDYCPKQLPLTRPTTCFGADDYRRRPCPVTVPPCPPPWYICAPGR